MDSQLEGFLNLLGEAERAGGRVLHDLAELAEGHRVNIGALEAALKEGVV
ncbi:MAG: hypothetical protein WCE23_04270 [Candidatus Binatus sp.]